MKMEVPRCPYFGECGGCMYQNIGYEKQLENKKNKLAAAIKYADIKVSSDNPYHYRNRMDFLFHHGGLGFRVKHNWKKVIDIKECIISNNNLNILLNEVRDKFKDCDTFDIFKQTGTFRYCVIRTPSNDSSISFVLNEDSMKLSDAIEKIKSFDTTAKNVVVAYVPKKTDESTSSEFFVVKGSEFLTEEILGKTFRYSIQGFFQNNSIMAANMHSYVRELLLKYDTKKHHLLDLYGGVGTFGIINSDLFKDVTIIESFAGCIDAAKDNIKANHVTNAKGIVLDAMNLKKLDFPKDLFVITDPPRSGMHPKTIEQLNKLNPEVIIYVSCNVEQLGKDLPKFKNHTIKSAALFDLFPQTPHSEAVVELVRTLQDNQ